MSISQSLSQKLWQANQDLAEASLHNPFVQGLGDGSLPKGKFVYYVGQDAFFLEAFARAYSISAAKAPDWESFQVFHSLTNGALQELNLHQGYAQQWDVDIVTVAPGKATRQYTDFLLSIAWSQSVGITAVAMSPCLRLYAYLGQKLAQNRSEKDIATNAYADWITTYSSNEFDVLVQQLDGLVDKHSPDIDLAYSTYRYAMTCERNFFQSAWLGDS
jgi:thiaminase (transcriptional activator TenA)